MIPARAVPLLEATVRARLNLILSGASGTGKTTLARMLALLIPESERACVLETETELWLHELRPQFFSLEERDANVKGAGLINMQDLFQRAASRHRENDLGSPAVSGLASYRILDDSWDRRREALVHIVAGLTIAFACLAAMAADNLSTAFRRVRRRVGRQSVRSCQESVIELWNRGGVDSPRCRSTGGI